MSQNGYALLKFQNCNDTTQKFILEQATKAKTGTRGTALLLL